MTDSTIASMASREIAKSQRAIFGVPDSTITELISEFESNQLHQVAASEGSAIAMAIGFWLQTKLPAHVYLQNSGLMNAGNPLLSLAHSSVYDVPMTLTLGWRGEPTNLGGKTDEPQHLATGDSTKAILHLLGFDVTTILSQKHYFDKVMEIHSKNHSRDALLVPRGIFDSRASLRRGVAPLFTRRQAIDEIYSGLGASHAFVAGTGYMSRDLSAAHFNLGPLAKSIFYLVGGMGHVSSVAAGIALGGRSGRVAAIEGDGGAMMHLGSIAALTADPIRTVDFFLIRNGVHASVGGQRILNPTFDFKRFAEACNFENIDTVITADELRNRVSKIKKGPSSRSSSFTLVQVQESVDSEPTSRPSGFKQIARDFVS
jgi:phosphonopyruvate decarboxylase